MNSETPWRRGSLRSPNGTHRLLFGRMYEDAEIERTAFRGRPRVFCIAGAGETANALSDCHEVVACDINSAQLAYAERRARSGAIEPGDAERLMNFMRCFMPLAGWRAKNVRDFIALSDVSEQTSYWRKYLDTLRFRVGFDALLSRAVLRAAYAPEFLSVLPPKFGAVLRRRLERGFALHPNATNPYVSALFLGGRVDERRPEQSPIQFTGGDAASFLELCPPKSFDAFALSNILDGAPRPYRSRLARAVRRAGGGDAVVVWRSFSEPAATHAVNHAEHDRAMIWGIVAIQTAQDFEGADHDPRPPALPAAAGS